MSYLYAQLHDQNGTVEISDLTTDGRREAAFQCYRLIEKLVQVDDTDPEAEGYASCCGGLDFAALMA